MHVCMYWFFGNIEWFRLQYIVGYGWKVWIQCQDTWRRELAGLRPLRAVTANTSSGVSRFWFGGGIAWDDPYRDLVLLLQLVVARYLQSKGDVGGYMRAGRRAGGATDSSVTVAAAAAAVSTVSGRLSSTRFRTDR